MYQAFDVLIAFETYLYALNYLYAILYIGLKNIPHMEIGQGEVYTLGRSPR